MTLWWNYFNPFLLIQILPTTQEIVKESHLILAAQYKEGLRPLLWLFGMKGLHLVAVVTVQSVVTFTVSPSCCQAGQCGNQIGAKFWEIIR